MSWSNQAAYDALLVKRMYAGDRVAWDELYHRHQPGLTAFLLRRARPAGEPEDIAGNVWLAARDPAARGVPAFDPEQEDFAAYLQRLATREVERLHKQAQRRRKHVTTGVEEEADRRADVTEGLRFEEFCRSLTEREHHYLQVYLLRIPNKAARAEFSAAARWKLDERLRRKAACVYGFRCTANGRRVRRIPRWLKRPSRVRARRRETWGVMA